MKKIPTAFIREYKNHKVVNTLNEYTNELCKKAVEEGIATLKIDGSCCAIINDELYKRYDCKKEKKAPEGAIPCCEPDPITGHWPHWVKCDSSNPADKWFIYAYNTLQNEVCFPINGTYEAIGPHFQGNPYNLVEDTLDLHGSHIITDLKRDFNSIKKYLKDNYIEGIVFWLDDEPICKIKRVDFGLNWNGSTEHKH